MHSAKYTNLDFQGHHPGYTEKMPRRDQTSGCAARHKRAKEIFSRSVSPELRLQNEPQHASLTNHDPYQPVGPGA